MSAAAKASEGAQARGHDSDDEFHDASDAPMPGDEVLENVDQSAVDEEEEPTAEDAEAGASSAAPVESVPGASTRAVDAPTTPGSAGGPGARKFGGASTTPFRSPRDGPFYTSFRLERKTRYLVVADVDGRWSLLNSAIRRFGADFVISCGNFGFYDERSADKLSDREVRSRVTQSHLPPTEKNRLLSLSAADLRAAVVQRAMLSDLPSFVVKRDGKQPGESRDGESKDTPQQSQGTPKGKAGARPDAGQLRTFHAPVYTVWGDREDLRVVECFRDGSYSCGNLFLLDHARSHRPAPGIRLFGIGGDFAYTKLFDNGDGEGSVAGAGGRLWVTMLQLGELMDTVTKETAAQRGDGAQDAPEDTKILVTHASPSREPLISLLAALLKADFSLSASTSAGHVLSYSDIAVGDPAEADRRQSHARSEVLALWNQVKDTIAGFCSEEQMRLFKLALRLTEPCPKDALKRLWNVCTSRIDSGHAVLCVDKRGAVGIETCSEGRDLHRRHSEVRDFNKDRLPARQNVRSEDSRDSTPRYDTALLRNLPFTSNEAEIRAFLKGCQVKNVSIGGRRPSEPRGTAIVDFDNHESLTKALKLSNSPLGGRLITVEPHRHEGRLWKPSDGTDSRGSRKQPEVDCRGPASNAQRTGAPAQVRKSGEVCRFFKQGGCRLGDNCPNAHPR
eukprot:Opistho-2@77557